MLRWTVQPFATFQTFWDISSNNRWRSRCLQMERSITNAPGIQYSVFNIQSLHVATFVLLVTFSMPQCSSFFSSNMHIWHKVSLLFQFIFLLVLLLLSVSHICHKVSLQHRLVSNSLPHMALPLHRPHGHLHVLGWVSNPSFLFLFFFWPFSSLKGVVRDFAGPYFVSEDNMAFGKPAKYWRLDPARWKYLAMRPTVFKEVFLQGWRWRFWMGQRCEWSEWNLW